MIGKFRVYDKVENKYSRKKFFIGMDGVLYVMMNRTIYSHPVIDVAAPGRYLVEWSICKKSSGDIEIKEAWADIYEGDVIEVTDGDGWVTGEHEAKMDETTLLIDDRAIGRILRTVHDKEES